MAVKEFDVSTPDGLRRYQHRLEQLLIGKKILGVALGSGGIEVHVEGGSAFACCPTEEGIEILVHLPLEPKTPTWEDPGGQLQ